MTDAKVLLDVMPEYQSSKMMAVSNPIGRLEANTGRVQLRTTALSQSAKAGQQITIPVPTPFGQALRRGPLLSQL